ncbi:MAG: short chain dehydrogenase, partial [Microcella sp.]|nr:short chain dehydrogenase [Microcella sp.]
ANAGRWQWANLQAEKRYSAWGAYGLSTLSNLVFARELQRLSDLNSWGITSVAAHPGGTATNLQTTGPRDGRAPSARRQKATERFMQGVDQGIVPALYAATHPAAEPGGYYGPNGFLEVRGLPAPARLPHLARDASAAVLLWEASERLTGVRYAEIAQTVSR